MIKIQNLSKIYDNSKRPLVAIDSINLDIDKGDIFGIVGLSGAGKSTLVRCINRIEKPSSGSIIINGVDMAELEGKALRQARYAIGMVFQNFNLFNSKTVYENVAFPLKVKGMDKNTIHQHVMDLLEKVELMDKKDVHPMRLSGGQKQRVGIARALAGNPSVLLCDEATSALDPKTTDQILTLLKRINKELGVTLIVITHEMDVVKSICNKVAILENGCIIESGETVDVFTHQSSEKTRHFINNRPIEGPHSKLAKNSSRLLLTFKGDTADRPVLAGLIQEFSLNVNIRSGSIDSIQETSVGKLIVDIPSTSNNLDEIIQYLMQHGAGVEVIS
ncbi:methionine ABC transporter ATP-binding protein [Fusibacter tunisiensis]|uniref:D-methionine transport system ATP-binding protein n=1 Tax=Fusibacter tunisiensis TaxID=1008308 RepID=A0ABS2MPV9_9FIRM|nr:ATP-binding cassette domain-containing protein [Fusibacter tunisiensis]MBM7561417.1 D-methionine transport system ATP-binding protein [Fusibacter tunisiensis]